MQIEEIKDRPPNYTSIRAVFPAASNEGVIFAYGDKIYNPSGVKIPKEIIDHELVHCKRQIEMGVVLWWEKYLDDPAFRYYEEVLAHRAEYKSFCARQTSRNQRRTALKFIAKRLSSSLYGKIVTFDKAKEDILND